tara:strand:- start:1524 stop:2300 length:777 start_codon:yes stop_codon:yes gene_type:complete
MKIISLGLGVQSTAMYLMSSLGEIDRADYAIFADPGAELPDTYQLLKDLNIWKSNNNGIPIIKKTKSLYKDIIKGQNSTGQRWASIPAFGESGGMIRRQCTAEYKIEVVVKAVRELHGLKKYGRMKPTEMWLGISLDEIQRMKSSQLYNIKYIYPLIDRRITRSDCYKFLEDNNFKNVQKSSCTFCPYHNNKQWKYIKENYPKEWKKVLKVDQAIRDSSKRGLNDKLYLHQSRKPIDEAYLQEDQEDLFMCEEGYCGI